MCTYNIQETYVDDSDPLMGLLVAAVFTVRYIYQVVKGKNPGHILFGRDMILPISQV